MLCRRGYRRWVWPARAVGRLDLAASAALTAVRIVRAARLAPIALLGAAACLPIPHRHTVRAGATFHVADENRRPLAGVTVRVYGGNVVSGILRPQAAVTTDERGIARVERRRQWHLFLIAVPDGEAPFVWAWCAEAPGFAPVIHSLKDDPSQTIEAVLQTGSAEAHCPPTLERLRVG